jgi:hypothetical protein
MRNLPLLTALLLVTCGRSPVSPSPMRRDDESIRFPKALESPGLRLGQSEQRARVDGAIVQAMMVAAKDFIPSSSDRSRCFTKPGDFFFDVIRQGEIIFVAISPDYYTCEGGTGPLDWGAVYAISTDGRILRRVHPEELAWTAPSSSPDAGESADAGYSRTGELSDFAHVFSVPVDDPPFFTRPEWLESENNPQRSLRNKLRTPSLPDGGTPDGGTPDGGTPDGGVHVDGGSPAILPR